MQFANVESERLEAKPGMAGTCPGCNGEVICKCGEERIWHWAHMRQRDCDPWWEPETLWHRRWKLHFPINMQEVVCRADCGEFHRADVKTQAGLVLEFQHSSLTPSEQRKRERFYRSHLVWVLDGTRLKGDKPRFANGRRFLQQLTKGGIFITREPAGCFPRQWLETRAPVFFDFGGADRQCRTLWCLVPGRAEERAVVVAISRDNFIELALTQPKIFDYDQIREAVAGYLKDRDRPRGAPLRRFERWQVRREAARRRF